MFDWFFTNTYWFERPMLERVGYYPIEKDGKLYVLINALGISPDDLNVEVQAGRYEGEQIVSVTGKTHDDVFNIDNSLRRSFTIEKQIKHLDWEAKNGFITLEFTFNEPVKPDVKVTRRK